MACGRRKRSEDWRSVGSEADIQGDGLAWAYLDLGDEAVKTVLSDFDNVAPFRNLHDQSLVFAAARPVLAVDEDVGARGPDSDRDSAGHFRLTLIRGSLRWIAAA